MVVGEKNVGAVRMNQNRRWNPSTKKGSFRIEAP